MYENIHLFYLSARASPFYLSQSNMYGTFLNSQLPTQLPSQNGLVSSRQTTTCSSCDQFTNPGSKGGKEGNKAQALSTEKNPRVVDWLHRDVRLQTARKRCARTRQRPSGQGGTRRTRAPRIRSQVHCCIFGSSTC